jgi:hypothetical protein
MTNYRDLPPGRLRRLAYSREIELEHLQELHLVSSRFQSLSIQPTQPTQPTNLVRRNALVRRAAFVVSRPNIVNGSPMDYSYPLQNEIDEHIDEHIDDQIDYSDMPPLETVPNNTPDNYTYEYLSELPNVIAVSYTHLTLPTKP